MNYYYYYFNTITKQIITKATPLKGVASNIKPNPNKLSPQFRGWQHGFMDGDGYLGLTKTGAYIKWELNFNQAERDKFLLEIQRKELGVGKVSKLKTAKTPTVRFRISSRKQIIATIFPLINANNLLTKHRYWQFMRANDQQNKNIIKFKDIPYLDKNKDIPNQTVESILLDPMFHDWLVGFIEAEGSFSYGETPSFRITQTNNYLVKQAINHILNLDTKVYIGSRDTTESMTHHICSTSSVRGFQNVIDFLTTPGKARLIGFKRTQFIEWCHKLKVTNRFHTLDISNIDDDIV